MTDQRKVAVVELAERCEAATGPDWSLDCDIARARGYHVPNPPTGGGLAVPTGSLPRFTASLDAAMTLVPEGWFWRVGHSTLYDGWAALNRVHPDHCNREDEAFAKAATPALALCAAALRSLSTPSMKE